MPEVAETTETETAETETVAPETSGKTFTQEDLDKIVEQRLSRERKKFSDYEDLKAKAAKADELEAEKLSELEKAQKRADDAEAALETLKATAKSEALKSAIREAARDAGADPASVLDALQGSASDLLELDADGKPTDMAATMEKLLEQRPNLKVATERPTPSADQGARGGGAEIAQLTREDLANMSPQEIVQARMDGRLTKLLG